MAERELRAFIFGDPAALRSVELNMERLTESLAQTIRHLYILCRRERDGDHSFGDDPRHLVSADGGRDAMGRLWKGSWGKIAAAAIAIGADPMSYVRAQFFYAPPRKPPLPNQMYGQPAEGKWRSFMRDSERQVERALSLEAQAVSREAWFNQQAFGWDADRARRQALFAPSTEASPLMRYCLAVDFNFTDVAERFHDEALVQYTFQKLFYDKHWQACLPESLKREGQALLDRLGVRLQPPGGEAT